MFDLPIFWMESISQWCDFWESKIDLLWWFTFRAIAISVCSLYRVVTGICINKNHLILGSSDHRWTWLHWSRWVIRTSKIWGYQWYRAFTLLRFDNCLILFCCEKVTLLVPFNNIKVSNKLQAWTPSVLFIYVIMIFLFYLEGFFFPVHVGRSQFLQSTLSPMICMEISSAWCKYWILTAAKRNIIT